MPIPENSMKISQLHVDANMNEQMSKTVELQKVTLVVRSKDGTLYTSGNVSNVLPARMATTAQARKGNQDKVHDFKTICVFEQFVRRKMLTTPEGMSKDKEQHHDVNSSRYEPAN